MGDVVLSFNSMLDITFCNNIITDVCKYMASRIDIFHSDVTNYRLNYLYY